MAGSVLFSHGFYSIDLNRAINFNSIDAMNQFLGVGKYIPFDVMWVIYYYLYVVYIYLKKRYFLNLQRNLKKYSDHALTKCYKDKNQIPFLRVCLC